MEQIIVMTDGNKEGYSIALFPNNERYYKNQPNITHNEAEYNGVILALEHLPEKANAIIQTDSQLVIGQFQEGWAVNYDHLYRKLTEMNDIITKKQLNVKLQWIPREKNTSDLVLRRHLRKIGVDTTEPLYEKVKRLEKENEQLREEIKKLKEKQKSL